MKSKSIRKTILVCGAGGFIGSHLVKRLVSEGHNVVGVDLKDPEFEPTHAQNFHRVDLTRQSFVESLFAKYRFDEVYQLAADMGGAEYIFSGENDANVFYNSGMINFNVLSESVRHGVKKIFYSSSACIYPEGKQMDVDIEGLKESDAYPANPDSEYGWEKIMSERLYMSFERNHGIQVRIGRYHNIYGPQGTWKGGKEKAPAATCRKVAEAMLSNNPEIVVFGDGKQTRSFLYIDECIEMTRRLMDSEYNKPLNIGSDFKININDLTWLVGDIAGLNQPKIKNVETNVQGVRGRNSDNVLIEQVLGVRPDIDLRAGLEKTYSWILGQVIEDKCK